MEQLTAITFIETRFIKDMKTALEAGLRYYVCPLLCQGIEIMGAFYDKSNFDDYGQSTARFKKGLSRLFFNKLYTTHADDLKRDFRGSMIHQLRPGSKVVLTSSVHDGAQRSDHLSVIASGQYYIVVEQLYDDFVQAFNVLKDEVKNGNPDIDSAKVNDIFFQYGAPQKIFDSSSTLADDGVYSRMPPLSGR